MKSFLRIPVKQAVAGWLLLLTVLHYEPGHGHSWRDRDNNSCDGDWCCQCRLTPNTLGVYRNLTTCRRQTQRFDCRGYRVINGTHVKPDVMFLTIMAIKPSPEYTIRDGSCDPDDPLGPCHHLILELPLSDRLLRYTAGITMGCNGYDVLPPHRLGATGYFFLPADLYPFFPDCRVFLTGDYDHATYTLTLNPKDHFTHALYQFAVDPEFAGGCINPVFRIERQTHSTPESYELPLTQTAFGFEASGSGSSASAMDDHECVSLMVGPLRWGEDSVSVALECGNTPDIAYPLGAASLRERLDIIGYQQDKPAILLDWVAQNAVARNLWAVTSNGQRSHPSYRYLKGNGDTRVVFRYTFPMPKARPFDCLYILGGAYPDTTRQLRLNNLTLYWGVTAGDLRQEGGETLVQWRSALNRPEGYQLDWGCQDGGQPALYLDGAQSNFSYYHGTAPCTLTIVPQYRNESWPSFGLSVNVLCPQPCSVAVDPSSTSGPDLSSGPGLSTSLVFLTTTDSFTAPPLDYDYEGETDWFVPAYIGAVTATVVISLAASCTILVIVITVDKVLKRYLPRKAAGMQAP